MNKSLRRSAIAMLTIAVTIAMTACGGKAVSSDRLEEARQTAKANGDFNA